MSRLNSVYKTERVPAFAAVGAKPSSPPLIPLEINPVGLSPRITKNLSTTHGCKSGLLIPLFAFQLEPPPEILSLGPSTS